MGACVDAVARQIGQKKTSQSATTRGLWRRFPDHARPLTAPGCSMPCEVFAGVLFECRRLSAAGCAGFQQEIGSVPCGIQITPHGKRRAVAPEVQGESACMRGQYGGHAHHFLHHCLQSPTLGRMTQRCVRSQQRLLTDQAQEVVRHGSQAEHEHVGVELAAGQALQIQVGLELAVELFVRAVIGVQRDDRVGRIGQRGRPAVDVDLGQSNAWPSAVMVRSVRRRMRRIATSLPSVRVITRPGASQVVMRLPSRRVSHTVSAAARLAAAHASRSNVRGFHLPSTSTRPRPWWSAAANSASLSKPESQRNSTLAGVNASARPSVRSSM